MKKRLQKTFIVLVFLLTQNSSFSQIKFGIKAGLNGSNISQNFKDTADESPSKMRFAYNVGVTLDYSINNKMSIQSGLSLSSKGFNVKLDKLFDDILGDGSKVTGSYKAIHNYLEIPIHLTYKASEKFQIYAGPYLAYSLGGKQKLDVTITQDGEDTETLKDERSIKAFLGTVNIADYDEKEELAVKALDYGLNAGIGCQIGSILINAGYSYGLGNWTPNIRGKNGDLVAVGSDSKIYNRVINLSVSYFFNQK